MSEEEQVTLIARVLTRDAEDGWGNTHAPASTVDQVHLSNSITKARQKKQKKGTGDAALDAFNTWAEGGG